MCKITKTTTEFYNGFVRRGVYVEVNGEIKQFAVVLPDTAPEAEIEAAQAAMLAKKLD